MRVGGFRERIFDGLRQRHAAHRHAGEASAGTQHREAARGDIAARGVDGTTVSFDPSIVELEPLSDDAGSMEAVGKSRKAIKGSTIVADRRSARR